MVEVRTDLALETREKFQEDNVDIKGVRLEEEEVEGCEIKITRVVIETENGAHIMGKPKGNYITLEAPNMDEQEEEYHQKIAQELATALKELLPKKEGSLSVLVVGLGNRQVTPDALGPKTADHLMITRHILREFGQYAFGEKETNQISSIVPGVMAQTGMESLEIIKGIAKETNPDCVIAIDALASRSTKRLARTIQITDTGINPGSGIGNHRHGLNCESLKVPVIAIGVPTVIDAATIVTDSIRTAFQNQEGALDEKIFQEAVSPCLNTMFVTPKDIDASIEKLSITISEGINLALE